VRDIISAKGPEEATAIMLQLQEKHNEAESAAKKAKLEQEYTRLCSAAISLIPKGSNIDVPANVDNEPFLIAYRACVDHKVTNNLPENHEYNRIRGYHKQLCATGQ
jgi:hypothetical protein